QNNRIVSSQDGAGAADVHGDGLGATGPAVCSIGDRTDAADALAEAELDIVPARSERHRTSRSRHVPVDVFQLQLAINLDGDPIVEVFAEGDCARAIAAVGDENLAAVDVGRVGIPTRNVIASARVAGIDVDLVGATEAQLDP